jgi:hypothetical protein
MALELEWFLTASSRSAITENTSGRRTLRDSLRNSFTNLLRSPHTTLLSRPFGLIFLLYSGTYMTANTIDTASSTLHNKPATAVTSGTAKFAFSSAANVSLCVYKDQCFARLFGPRGVAPSPVPRATYALFAARDCLTIFASFNVPPLLGPVLSQKLGKEMQKTVSGQTIAQFLAPAAVQILSTPLHLLGLDLYNKPKGTISWAERWTAVRKNWTISALARMGRIIPAFGVGGVVNTGVRRNMMAKLA